MTKAYRAKPGKPAPLGPTVTEEGVNFALFSAHASAVTLCLFSKSGKTETAQIPLTAKTGDIWHGCVQGLTKGQLYGYRVDGPYEPRQGHRFNPHKLLIDPYAKQLFGEFIMDDALYGYIINAPEKDLSFDARDSAPYMPKCVVGDVNYDGPVDKSPGHDLTDLVIYECHVKGATMLKEDVPVKKRGTFEGLASPAMIKHLVSLGVTAIEILPAQSFFTEPRLTGLGLTNYWGYNPVNYFAPHNAYLGPKKARSIQVMVAAMHKAGIEVILDVVYNHTAESWELGPTLSYRGIDNKSYYHLKSNQRYYENYTGTGNALDMTHPAVLDMTIASLRHWVEVYRIDGFRFDLGPTMGRNPVKFDRNAKFFKAIKNDPVLASVKLISEPWDIGPGGYQLGAFPNGWSEWNDQYRDSVRSFWRGDRGSHQELAGRLLGSAKNFDHDKKKATASVNFITSHDGFTLHDVVSFKHKHNHANGEHNRDGHGHNLSGNMGVEGPTDDPDILEARRRRKSNMLATLLLSQGIPMLLAGDEFGQSQGGNNNAYCQDNVITWLDWSSQDEVLRADVAKLIDLRRTFPHFRQTKFLHGEAIGGEGAVNIAWVNPKGDTKTTSQWEAPKLKFLGMLLSMKGQGSVYVIFNRGPELSCKLPRAKAWNMEFSTGAADLAIDHCRVSAHCVSVFSSPDLAVPRDVAAHHIETSANAAGIISQFHDVSGQLQVATLDTKSAILNAMDWPSSNPSETGVSDKAATVYGAEQLRNQGKVWGITAALYGLRSQRNWGNGDFEDLARFAEIAAGQGASFIGINPVHALFPSASHLFAPYSPSSREFLNVMHIAPDRIDELASYDLREFQSDITKSRAADFVDYSGVYAVKMKAFDQAFKIFQALPSGHKRRKAYSQFVKAEGKGLRQHAIFDAIFESLPKAKQTYDGFRNFPKALQNVDNPRVEEFARKHSARVEFYLYLQWLAHNQLNEAQARAQAAGMSIGLYLDFAVGVAPGGADAWRHPKSFVRDISLGAPGDAANPDGQKWSLLPLHPHRLATHNLEPYRTSVKKVMALAGAVRIDHILGHMRSFWIPENGGSGAYVKYPMDQMLGMIAEVSQAAKCIVIGEDLGTVPDGLRRTMADIDLMGCGIVIIERGHHGQLLPLEAARDLSLTAYSNHDFPTLSGFWAEDDLRWRKELGISASSDQLDHERRRRREDKAQLAHQAGIEIGQGEALDIAMSAQLHRALAASPALMVAVQLEDLLLQMAQPNIPGTTDEQPNWRRKYEILLEDFEALPAAKSIMSAMREIRPVSKG